MRKYPIMGLETVPFPHERYILFQPRVTGHFELRPGR